MYIKELQPVCYSILIILAVTTGCSSKEKIKPQVEESVYSYSMSQLPPQPVYYRFKRARSPQPLPVGRPLIGEESLPDVVVVKPSKEIKLGHLMQRIAKSMDYEIYVSSLVFDRVRLVPKIAGKSDVVLGKIAEIFDVKVIIDHTHRKLTALNS